MTHQEEYDKIINFRKSNPLPVGQYGENHHVVPKSVCPILEHSLENIVRLSAQEHFLAHYHLWHTYRDELKEKTWARKMAVAFGMMKKQLLKCDDIEAMSRLYEEARVDFSNALKGRRLTENTKKKMSNARKGMKLPTKTRHKLSILNSGKNHPLFGLHHSDETRKKMSESHKGQIPWTKGKHWFTDGKTSVFANTCPTGFYKGRAKRT